MTTNPEAGMRLVLETALNAWLEREENTFDVIYAKDALLDHLAAALAAAPVAPAGSEGLEVFPHGATEVQSRFVIVHQLRASADIQTEEVSREYGRPATTDRATLMRKAADTIEALAARTQPPVGEVECERCVGTGWIQSFKAVHTDGGSVSCPDCCNGFIAHPAEPAARDGGEAVNLAAMREHALAMTQKHGNPDGTDYEQGQNDMGHRWITSLDAALAASGEK